MSSLVCDGSAGARTTPVQWRSCIAMHVIIAHRS